MVTKAAPIDSLTASTDEAEPLHTGDDERLDMMTNIITALEGMIEDPDPDITIESILEDCRALDVLLVATVQRELAACVDPSPLAQLDLAKFISEWQWNSGDGPPLFNGEYHEQRAALHRFGEALRAALVAPTPEK